MRARYLFLLNSGNNNIILRWWSSYFRCLSSLLSQHIARIISLMPTASTVYLPQRKTHTHTHNTHTHGYTYRRAYLIHRNRSKPNQLYISLVWFKGIFIWFSLSSLVSKHKICVTLTWIEYRMLSKWFRVVLLQAISMMYSPCSRCVTSLCTIVKHLSWPSGVVDWGI